MLPHTVVGDEPAADRVEFRQSHIRDDPGGWNLRERKSPTICPAGMAEWPWMTWLGMMSDEQMGQLEAASGAGFDECSSS
jgi:hypothetical protein